MANVAGALVPGGAGDTGASLEIGAPVDEPSRAVWESLLSSIFVTVADAAPAGAGPTPLAVLEAVVRHVGCDRVLVADPRRPVADLEVLLALTAWPEEAALVYADETGCAVCALVRTTDVLDQVGEVEDVDGLLTALGAQHLDRAGLGLAGAAGPSPSLREAC